MLYACAFLFSLLTALGQAHSLPSFGLGWCDLAMCVAVWVGFHITDRLNIKSKFLMLYIFSIPLFFYDVYKTTL
jgi:hypothetical protein